MANLVSAFRIRFARCVLPLAVGASSVLGESAPAQTPLGSYGGHDYFRTSSYGSVHQVESEVRTLQSQLGAAYRVYLASLGSAHEDSWLRYVVGTRFWIGLTGSPDGGYSWASGEAVTYTNWLSPPEPTGCGAPHGEVWCEYFQGFYSPETYVQSNHYSGGYWNDLSDLNTAAYAYGVIEVELLPCSIDPLAPLPPDPATQDLELGLVDLDDLTPATRAAYTCLQSAGGTWVATSAYRTPAYQAHLAEVYAKHHALQTRGVQCADARAAVQTEYDYHRLGASKIMPAVRSGAHTRGTALDMTVSGVGDIDAVAIGCGLWRPHMRPGHEDPVHFELLFPGPVAMGSTRSVTLPSGAGASKSPRPSSRTGALSQAELVTVGVVKRIFPDSVRYEYSIMNGSEDSLLAVAVGINALTPYDSASAGPELLETPLGWSSVAGGPAGAVGAPPGWSGDALGTEESDLVAVEWVAESPIHAVPPGATLGGLTVTVEAADSAYESGHWTAYSANGSNVIRVGEIVLTSTTEVEPSSAGLFAVRAWPNPSRGHVTIQFDLPRAEVVVVTVHDVAGRRLALLASGLFTAGQHAVSWDGRGKMGAPAGVYFVNVRAGAERRVQTLVIINH